MLKLQVLNLLLLPLALSLGACDSMLGRDSGSHDPAPVVIPPYDTNAYFLRPMQEHSPYAVYQKSFLGTGPDLYSMDFPAKGTTLTVQELMDRTFISDLSMKDQVAAVYALLPPAALKLAGCARLTVFDSAEVISNQGAGIVSIIGTWVLSNPSGSTGSSHKNPEALNIFRSHQFPWRNENSTDISERYRFIVVSTLIHEWAHACDDRLASEGSHLHDAVPGTRIPGASTFYYVATYGQASNPQDLEGLTSAELFERHRESSVAQIYGYKNDGEHFAVLAEAAITKIAFGWEYYEVLSKNDEGVARNDRPVIWGIKNKVCAPQAREQAKTVLTLLGLDNELSKDALDSCQMETLESGAAVDRALRSVDQAQ